MLIKVKKSKYIILLILRVFCLSNTKSGRLLLYGQDFRYDRHSVHIHFTEEDHGISETNCSDTTIALYHDYLTTTLPVYAKTSTTVNLYLYTNICHEYQRNFSRISSVHHSSINRFCFTGLYQLNSSVDAISIRGPFLSKAVNLSGDNAVVFAA